MIYADYLIEATKALDVAALDQVRRVFTATSNSLGGNLLGRQRMFQDAQRLLNSAKSSYQSAISRLVNRVRSGSMNSEQAVAAFRATIDDVYKKAYMSGALRSGNQYYKELGLTQSDAAIARSGGTVESGFWKSFVKDVADKSYPASRIDQRALMYAQAIEAQHWNGYVAGLGPDSQLAWILGDPETDHCTDCEEIAANSPYTPSTLPTTPRAGDTDCLSRCYCELAEITTPDQLARGFVPPQTGLTYDEIEGLNPAEVYSGSLPAPESFSAPFQDLYGEVNRLRQLIELDVANSNAYIMARKRVVEEIRRLQEALNVRVVPRYSVKELVRTVNSLVEHDWKWGAVSGEFTSGEMVREVRNTFLRSGMVESIVGNVVRMRTIHGIREVNLGTSLLFSVSR